MLNVVSLRNKNYGMKTLPNRIDKKLQWLESSRDSWKDKCIQVKNQLKKTTLAMKRARRGRDHWKKKMQKFKNLAVMREVELRRIDAENKKLKKDINQIRKEIGILKKKASQ